MLRIALLSLPLALGACSRAEQAPPAPPPPEVTVVTVHAESVPLTVELPGRTSAYLVAQVRARGRTQVEVQDAIVTALKNRAIEPQVIVSMVEQKTSMISVLGEGRAARIPATWASSLSNARPRRPCGTAGCVGSASFTPPASSARCGVRRTCGTARAAAPSRMVTARSFPT